MSQHLLKQLYVIYLSALDMYPAEFGSQVVKAADDVGACLLYSLASNPALWTMRDLSKASLSRRFRLSSRLRGRILLWHAIQPINVIICNVFYMHECIMCCTSHSQSHSRRASFSLCIRYLLLLSLPFEFSQRKQNWARLTYWYSNILTVELCKNQIDIAFISGPTLPWS